jgi:hypothetical protein
MSGTGAERYLVQICVKAGSSVGHSVSEELVALVAQAPDVMTAFARCNDTRTSVKWCVYARAHRYIRAALLQLISTELLLNMCYQSMLLRTTGVMA